MRFCFRIESTDHFSRHVSPIVTRFLHGRRRPSERSVMRMGSSKGYISTSRKVCEFVRCEAFVSNTSYHSTFAGADLSASFSQQRNCGSGRGRRGRRQFGAAHDSTGFNSSASTVRDQVHYVCFNTKVFSIVDNESMVNSL